MPNETISCASTGNSSQSSSTRKDKKPVKIRATLFYGTAGYATPDGDDSEGKGPHSAFTGNPDWPVENASNTFSQLEARLQQNRTGFIRFDTTFSLYIDAPEADEQPADILVSDTSGNAPAGFGAGIARGMKALYQDILSINAPDKLLELISIDACDVHRGSLPARTGIHGVLQKEGLVLRQQLEAAGYTVLKLDLSVVELLHATPLHATA